MRSQLRLGISILALSLATAANAQKAEWQVFSEPFVSSAHAQDIDWAKIDETLGRKPAVAVDVHRYGFPRTDLTVTLDAIKPALALGGWIAFKPMHGGAMIMGDLVLLEPESNPVMLKLIANGFDEARLANSDLKSDMYACVPDAPVSDVARSISIGQVAAKRLGTVPGIDASVLFFSERKNSWRASASEIAATTGSDALTTAMSR